MAEDVSLDVTPDLPTRNVTSGVRIDPLLQPPLISYSRKGMAQDMDEQDPPEQRTSPLGELLYRPVGSPWEYTRYIQDYALVGELLMVAGIGFGTAVLSVALSAELTEVPADMAAFMTSVKTGADMDTYAAMDYAITYLEAKLKNDDTMADGRKYRDVVRTGGGLVGRELLTAAGIPT